MKNNNVEDEDVAKDIKEFLDILNDIEISIKHISTRILLSRFDRGDFTKISKKISKDLMVLRMLKETIDKIDKYTKDIITGEE